MTDNLDKAATRLGDALSTLYDIAGIGLPQDAITPEQTQIRSALHDVHDAINYLLIERRLYDAKKQYEEECRVALDIGPVVC